ncbi:MAG: carbamoyltransferase, partial [Spirochaetes bacterium]|nr:carbamoyltransferase [Spirochaetota bacterium]
MYILGINIGRNTSAALVKDGLLIACAEEERFIREKGTDKFPRHAIQFCLDYENLSLADIDYITYSYDLSIGVFRLFLHFLRYFP